MEILNWVMLEAEAGALREQWADAGSVPYVLINDFALKDACEELANFNVLRGQKAKPKKRNHKNVYRKAGTNKWEQFTALQKAFFTEVNSPKFLAWIARVTGIAPIYADDELFGGGLHEILPGGFLNVHTDFNHHPATLKHRRLNLLVYLNPVWRTEWNGQIELWDEGLSRPVLSAEPIIGRALLFETSERSFHGHPKPLACPHGYTRRSLATYYYSDFPLGLSPRKMTNYQLTRQQWAGLMSQIADLVFEGEDEAACVAKLQLDYQVANIQQAYRTLMGMRSPKSEDEPYWEMPNGSKMLSEPSRAEDKQTEVA